MQVRRPLLVLAVIVGASIVIGAPAFADRFAQGPLQDEPFVVLTGELRLLEGASADDAIIFNGPAQIDGDVRGQVVAFNGDVIVSGVVGENVVALNGRVYVADGAQVGGDVVSRYRPVVSDSATVGGELRRVSRLNFNLGEFTVVSRILVWLATSVSSFLLGLLLVLFVPRAADATAKTAVDRLGASIGFGFLVLIGLPLAAFVAIGILVGIPLGLGLLFALGFVYWLGYTAGAYALGRRLVSAPTHRLVAFLAGFGILRGLALIPVVAGLAWLAATVWGLGALVIAARAAGRDTPAAAVAVGVGAGGPPPPVPPPPPLVTPGS
jgi:cytoskeletal protein CcmA (bactofilin family)